MSIMSEIDMLIGEIRGISRRSQGADPQLLRQIEHLAQLVRLQQRDINKANKLAAGAIAQTQTMTTLLNEKGLTVPSKPGSLTGMPNGSKSSSS